MKRILILVGLVLFINGTAFADTVISGSVKETASASLKMSDVEVFSEKNLFGIKDKSGNIVVKPQYKKIIKLGNTSWIIQKKNRFGLMDSSGNYLIKPKYRHVDRYFGKFVKLGNDKDYGLYDETGKVIVPPEYTSIDPLFGKMFLTCKNYKYGIVNYDGKKLLDNEFDDIYMPRPTAVRLQYNGEWYEIERMTSKDITLPEGVKKVTINDKEFKVTHLVENSGILSGYSLVTATDYTLKIFSSLSPAYEQTIDELMLSQGAETVNIFIKLGWIPRFPFTYAKKYFDNLVTPNNGPLADIKYDLKKQIK